MVPPIVVATALPNFMVVYPTNHPVPAPIASCFGGEAFERSFMTLLTLYSPSLAISEIGTIHDTENYRNVCDVIYELPFKNLNLLFVIRLVLYMK